MNQSDPKARLEMIDISCRCLWLGIFGFVPVVGLFMAVAAMRQGRRVRKMSAGQWNPAEAQAKWGSLCGGLGFVAFFVEVVLGVAIYIKATFPE